MLAGKAVPLPHISLALYKGAPVREELQPQKHFHPVASLPQCTKLVDTATPLQHSAHYARDRSQHDLLKLPATLYSHPIAHPEQYTSGHEATTMHKLANNRFESFPWERSG